MPHVLVTDDSEVRILTLSRPRANAMNHAMVDEVLSAVRDAAGDDRVRAVVIASDQKGFFSAGFDVEEVFDYDLPAMRHFFTHFMDLFERLLHMPKPVIGAISGHTWAGGAFLSLAFDLRVFGKGEYGFALNEINFGAVLPTAIRKALIGIVGTREGTRIILDGESIAPQKALAINLADALVPHEEVSVTALRLAHRMAEKPRNAFAFTKGALQQDAGYPTEREPLDSFFKQWFSPECVERRRALTAALKAKSAKR
jgi:enoyl-CoA hydratase/carnithine racemase